MGDGSEGACLSSHAMVGHGTPPHGDPTLCHTLQPGSVFSEAGMVGGYRGVMSDSRQSQGVKRLCGTGHTNQGERLELAYLSGDVVFSFTGVVLGTPLGLYRDEEGGSSARGSQGFP